ncbi:MAG: hypothetical protein L0338_36685, partial [Acidobacteria bacterium]|nr:hypothetical protein [Acidobacteriota bacterium]
PYPRASRDALSFPPGEFCLLLLQNDPQILGETLGSFLDMAWGFRIASLLTTDEAFTLRLSRSPMCSAGTILSSY